MLIRANAMLHQASRRRDEDGRFIAQIQDYVVVRELIADLVAVGVDATVKPEVREVVRAVSALIEKVSKRFVSQNSSRLFNLINRRSRGGSLMLSMADFSKTWKTARGVPPGS